jgi:hypothetical protein
LAVLGAILGRLDILLTICVIIADAAWILKLRVLRLLLNFLLPDAHMGQVIITGADSSWLVVPFL